MNTADIATNIKKTMRKDRSHERKTVEEILKGNEKALNGFYKQYFNSLYGYISKKVNNQEDIEEILQDTLLSTIEAFRDFSFKCSLFTFICSIANHKIVDYYRRKKIKTYVFSRFEEIEPILANLVGPEEIYDEEIVREQIRATFQKLTPSYRRILTLKYIYGYSVLEIAGKMSITFKSAESQLFRARKAFVLNYSHG